MNVPQVKYLSTKESSPLRPMQSTYTKQFGLKPNWYDYQNLAETNTYIHLCKDWESMVYIETTYKNLMLDSIIDSSSAVAVLVLDWQLLPPKSIFWTLDLDYDLLGSIFET